MTNRLAGQTSPYLLQHAGNPVDWYPWGDEAFERARAEDKPVLLSVGYAACHWCHVMERESFEDEQTARLQNEWFVNVKVDREERPDVDAIYMGAVQALTGQGGWPMTVFCTPDGVPFLGGTYFPPTDRHGMPSFKRVLESVHELWTTRRDELLDQGQRVLESISQSPPPSQEPLQASLLSAAARQIASNYDPVHGGFGRAPKFPQAPVLEFLLRAGARDAGLREQLEHTLRRMALGGIYDQLGGGFARYSVDAQWLVPHFEKMLYDNAQLASVYLHAWQAYGDPFYRRIATETLEYLLRDMRDERGGFHSSEDADSEGVEGRFSVWSYEQFREHAPEAAEYYGVTEAGNFEGTNILTAAGAEPPEEARRRLWELRERRVRPGKDDKVLASWNGLAVAALAESGAAFDRPDFLDAAREAASFVLDAMAQDGRLLHTYRAGRAHVTGLLEDYGFACHGLLALWEATFETRWLNEARRLAAQAAELFGDPAGGFFTTASDHERLILRQKEIVEGATPAPGAALSLALQRLAVLFDAPDLAKPGVDALRSAHVYMDRAAQAVPTWLCALDFYLSTPTEIAFTGDIDSEPGRALVATVTSRYLPNRVLAARRAPDTDGEIALLRDKPADGQPTAYVCERYVCKQPTSDPHELAAQL